MRKKSLFIFLFVGLIVLCALLVAYTAYGSRRVKAAWLASYPELCSQNDLSIIPMALLPPGSYLLKCAIYPKSMDYANPLEVVNSRECTAVLYLPNLSLPGEYLGKFSSTTRMPVCP